MSALPCTEVAALFVSRAPPPPPRMPAFCFLHFAPLQNELCKAAPWEGIGMAHLIKELLEINAALLGAPVGVWRRLHVQYTCLWCCACEMWIFIRVCACLCPRLFGSVSVCVSVCVCVCLCVCASFLPSLLFALHPCMYACVVLLPVSLSAQRSL